MHMLWLRKSFATSLVLVSYIALSALGLAQMPASASLQVSSTKVFVLNKLGNSITVYALYRAGNVAPVRMISGPMTRLAGPRAFAIDRFGNLYVVNGQGNEILIFGALDNGNVAPRATIRGADTGLDQSVSVAIDATGHLLVLGADRSIEKFNPAATGDAKPLAIADDFLPTGAFATSIGSDSLGRFFLSDPVNSNVYVFAETQAGVGTLEKTISGATTQIITPVGIAVDPIGRLYISLRNESVLLIPNFDRGDLAPTVALHGSSTQISGAGVSGFDSGACIYTPNFRSNSITVFDPGTTGNTAPSAIYRGKKTRLNGPIAALLF